MTGEIDVATHSRQARGDHHREPDGRRDADHLRHRRASLSGRHSPAVSDPVSDPARLVAGTVHLHVHLDGEVRRRLWRAHRHPCRRRRADQAAQRAGARASSCSACSAARCSPRRRHHGREIRHRIDEHRPGLARSGIAELDRLRLHSARLLSDVLPLPAGVLDLLLDRRTAASRRDQCRRHRGHVPTAPIALGEA